MTKAEQALNLAERISTTRQNLRVLEEQFYGLFDESPQSVQVLNMHADTEKADGVPSIAEKMRSVFLKNPGKIVTVSDFTKALPSGTPIKTVRSTITRIVAKSNGKFVAVNRGKYKFLVE